MTPAPDTYQVVSRRPPDAPPPTPLDLPQMLLGLAGLSGAQHMRAELQELHRVVRDCDDEDLDRFLTRTVKALLRSKGMSSEELEEATTMQTVVTAFERSLTRSDRRAASRGSSWARYASSANWPHGSSGRRSQRSWRDCFVEPRTRSALRGPRRHFSTAIRQTTS